MFIYVNFFFFWEPPSLVNDLIYITSFTPKTMDFFMLSSTDNTVSVTQIHQGIRCQEALFMKEYIWIQDIYSASGEVQWEEEIALSYSLHFAAQGVWKPSKCQPAWVKTDYLPCAVCWNPGTKVSRTQDFKKINPSSQRLKLWFQQRFFYWIKLCGSAFT